MDIARASTGVNVKGYVKSSGVNVKGNWTFSELQMDQIQKVIFLFLFLRLQLVLLLSFLVFVVSCSMTVFLIAN